MQKMLVRLASLEKQAAGEKPSGLPIGALLQWTSDTSLPIGYLRCEGQAVSRSTYSALFNIIGTTFGAGNGSSTFNLPNFKGLVARGAGTQDVNGRTKDGGSLGDVLEDQMQKITGVINNLTGIRGQTSTATGAFADTIYTNDSAVGGSSRGVNQIKFDSADSPDARTSATTEGETRVSSLTVVFIIKAQNLEITSATSSAINSLNARVSDLESANNYSFETKALGSNFTTTGAQNLSSSLGFSGLQANAIYKLTLRTRVIQTNGPTLNQDIIVNIVYNSSVVASAIYRFRGNPIASSFELTGVFQTVPGVSDVEITCNLNDNRFYIEAGTVSILERVK